eukprot:Rhum_TRINITY_DN14668_c23_g1::Rhum_TRINITY_DN14668_c23_g1_i1::g.109424::m.109424
MAMVGNGVLTEELVDEIQRKWPSLRSLSLENNGVRDLGRSLARLSTLVKLNLRGNVLRSLDGLDLPSLTSLNVSHNDLRSLEGVQGCPRLARVAASHNRLQSFLADPAAPLPLDDLTHLDVAHNRLASVAPLSRCARLALRKLNVSHNALPSLSAVTEALGGGGGGGG